MKHRTSYLLLAFLVIGVLSCNNRVDSGITFQDITDSPNDSWLTYSGDYSSQRYSLLKQINIGNVAKLKKAWTYHMNEYTNLRTTPLVADGVMYVTRTNEVHALRADSGALIWKWDGRPDTGRNRGVAILGNIIFFATSDCDLVALDKNTGAMIWQQQYARGRGYYATMAPLALKDKIIVGVGGGDNGTRGFVAAYSIEGKELWRLWTTYTPRGGAATWMSGSYDSKSNTLYWTTGNPWPDYDGRERPGDNLYSNCVIAINPETGKMKWYFQFTPHDIRDWDSNEMPVLVNMFWHGRFRQLLLQANRNGFFYVLDRTTGEFLLGKPFVKVTWADGLDKLGRPIESRLNQPWNDETKGICPGVSGATNWMSPTYNQETELFYVLALEHCDQNPGVYYIRAIDPQSGNIAWEYQMNGKEHIMAGMMSTAGNLVFAGDDKGQLLALNAQSGKLLWSGQVGSVIFASPITFFVGGKQYVTLAAGTDIVTFRLP